jgi:hypothetical protein
MKKCPPTKTHKSSIGCTVFALLVLASSAAMAQEAQIISRPLSPKDVTTYGPTNAQVSGGLFTVGVGSAVYLEAQVLKGTPVSSIAWALATKPSTSAVALATSPLGTNVPSFEPSDRLTYDVAGRQLLVPDVRGQYTVTATVTTSGTNTIVLTRVITAANYVGVGFVDGSNVATGKQCAKCHDGETDKLTPWSGTPHATFLTRAIDGQASSSYKSTCIKCHTVGYDTALTATNGGFDDVAKQLSWTFPTNLTNGNWAAMPMALKQVSNIQCENCHGPGSEHGGNIAKTSVSFSAGNCAVCHSSGSNHIKPQEWANSRHAIAVREESASCAGCHSGIGFIDQLAGAATIRTNYSAITCATCHDPHDATNPSQLRSASVVTLKDTSRPGGATVITNAGKGMLCMQCHMSRRDAVTYVKTTAGSSRFGPHHGPQTDMLMGVNAITYGKVIPSSGHGTVVSNTCVTCHMQTVASTNTAFLQAGGHTFKVAAAIGTTNITSVDLVGACQSCHGVSATSLDLARQDYDGNGIIEGVQTEVNGLLNKLAMMLPPIGQPTVVITTNYTPKQLSAAYNYLFVLEDGSFGVHNTAYAVGLLKASMADLTDDGNNDGLPDTWQIAYFGSAASPNAAPNASPSGDSVPNWLKYTLGLDPTKPGIAVPGGVVWASGSGLVNPPDPGGTNTVKIFTAAEVAFNTVVGKTYQIQAVSSLGGGWQNVGNPIPGTGAVISYVTPTRQNVQQFFRIVTTP